MTDLQILAHLAQYHSWRIQAGISLAIHQRSRDIGALDDAIEFEKKAIKAWTDLVDVAGDVYAPDLMMGLASAGLSGHWRDELSALHTGLAALQKQRERFQAAPGIVHVPVHKHPAGVDLVIRATFGGADPKAEIRLHYKTANGAWQALTMDSKQPSLYRAVIPGDEIQADFQYYLGQAAGGVSLPREGKAGPVQVMVSSDITPPEVIHSPIALAEAGRPLTIQAQVKDLSGVKWARVLYRPVNQKLDFRVLPMTPVGAGDLFQATVPAEALSPEWDFMYLIEVMDNKSNGRIFPDLEKETPYIVVRVKQTKGS